MGMKSLLIVASALLGLAAAPAAAQIRTIDPNSAIDADLDSQPAPYPEETPAPVDEPYQPSYPAQDAQGVPPATTPPQDVPSPTVDARAASASTTYSRDDLIGAAEGVFGRGAEGLAGIIEDILRDQGEPNAYIAGREASGAFIIGLRYGSGTLFHRIEGQRPVYWTGPSVGFDVGGDAAKVFVLVYNLYDTQELYKRFPAGEGRVYFVGGFSAAYLRSGETVLIPVRRGVGWRLGANVGYMKFTEESRWLPF